ncbi:MAG: LysR family transcriptional regulator [Chromatiaceae bacterium]|nr:LysR family transcriptional regulator [Chromatiaceae bacterium]
MLRTFLEVAGTRRFRLAAEALHLTQAAVSARIRTSRPSSGWICSTVSGARSG